jgi:hypothetical protein
MDWKGVDMKNKLLQILVIIIVLVFIVPSINAIILKNTKNDDEATCIGMIYGHTHTSYCWNWIPVNFAVVDAGIKKTYSTVNGFYVLSGLMLGKTYKVTASKKGYHNDTHYITLTKDSPVVKQFFDLQPYDEDIKLNKVRKKLIENNSLNLGVIFGKTFWKGGWGFGNFAYVNIYAIGKFYYRNKISGTFGYFSLFVP